MENWGSGRPCTGLSSQGTDRTHSVRVLPGAVRAGARANPPVAWTPRTRTGTAGPSPPPPASCCLKQPEPSSSSKTHADSSRPGPPGTTLAKAPGPDTAFRKALVTRTEEGLLPACRAPPPPSSSSPPGKTEGAAAPSRPPGTVPPLLTTRPELCCTLGAELGPRGRRGGQGTCVPGGARGEGPAAHVRCGPCRPALRVAAVPPAAACLPSILGTHPESPGPDPRERCRTPTVCSPFAQSTPRHTARPRSHGATAHLYANYFATWTKVIMVSDRGLTGLKSSTETNQLTPLNDRAGGRAACWLLLTGSRRGGPGRGSPGGQGAGCRLTPRRAASFRLCRTAGPGGLAWEGAGPPSRVFLEAELWVNPVVAQRLSVQRAAAAGRIADARSVVLTLYPQAPKSLERSVYHVQCRSSRNRGERATPAAGCSRPPAGQPLQTGPPALRLWGIRAEAREAPPPPVSGAHGAGHGTAARLQNKTKSGCEPAGRLPAGQGSYTRVNPSRLGRPLSGCRLRQELLVPFSLHTKDGHSPPEKVPPPSTSEHCLQHENSRKSFI